MSWHGNIRLGETLDVKFTTVNSSGVPTTLSGTPDVAAYANNGTVEITGGITLTVDFDSRTGLNNVRILATSGNGYAAGSNYHLVIRTGTVDGNSVVGYVVGSFSIEARTTSIDGTINTLDDLATRVGTAQAGSSSSITLDAGASSSDNFYGGQTVVILSGTGAGQAQLIDSYVGTTKVATVDFWVTAPDATSVFAVMPWGLANVTSWYYETVNVLSGGRVQTDVRAISSDAIAANNLEAALDGTGGVTLSADLAGTINGLTAAALADFFDTDSGSTYGGAVAGSVVKETADNAASGGSAPTAGEVADAVWDEAKAGHVGAGSFGEEVQAHALSSEVTALNDLSAAEVNAEVDTALADYDGPTHAELTSEINDVQTDIAALNDPTAASIADAVWDEAQADHTTAGTTGESLNDASSGGGGSAPTAGEVADAVWDEAQAGHVTAGTFGEIATEIASVLEDTGTTLDGKLDVIDAIVDAILVDTDATIPGLIAALNDLSTSDVNAQVLDVLNTDTFGEPASVPPATASLVQKIGWLFLLSRNKIDQTATTQTIRNDADSANVGAATVSDDGTTAQRGKWS